MNENLRNAGIGVMLILTAAGFIGFLAMMLKPNPSPYGWFGLLGLGAFIVLILLVLRKDR